MNNNEYWAKQGPSDLKEALNERIEDYYNYCNNTLLSLWRQSYRYFNYACFTGGKLQIEGDNNEYTTLGVNHYRNLIEHSITMAINQAPAWEPRATNGDTVSQKQCILARGLLDYYMREKNLARALKQALTYASLYGEGFLSVDWNATSGEAYAVNPDTGITQYQGDIEYKVYAPIDVIRSPSLYGAKNAQWYVVRDFVNKYDLAEKYGKGDEKVRNAILGASKSKDPKTLIFYSTSQQMADDDQIALYRFFHDRSDSVTEGRYTLFTEDVVLSDGPLPSSKLNVYRITPGELECTPFGYSSDYDLLSIQEMINVLYSTVSSNQSAFGVQNIAVPRGSGTTITEVRDGMNLIEFDAVLGKPEPLNLANTPPEIFKFMEMLERTAETLSGVNQVARGNPQASLQSGAALALVQSMAVQFMMGLQSSYINLLEDVGTATITMLREYASVPRVAAIVGRNKRSMMKEFTANDLSNINRVQVDSGNPMSKTVSGKIELATMMLQAKLISTPDELLQVIQTGSIDPLVSGKTSELLLIQSENEKLSDGEDVPVLMTDDHVLHINEHKSILADPLARSNPKIIEATLKHQQEHINQLKNPQYIEYMKLTNQPSLAQPTQGSMQNMQQSAQASNPVQKGANVLAEQMQPNLPNMPKNPLDGQKPNQQ